MDQYQELIKMGALADEIHRSRQNWTSQYMTMLHFSHVADIKAKRMAEALESVMQLLDMQPVQNVQIKEAMIEIATALETAARIERDSVRPQPVQDDATSLETCAWWLDMDKGVKATPARAGGGFVEADANALWEAYRTGAKFGHAEAMKSYAK